MTAYGSVLSAGYNGDGLRAWKQGPAGRVYFIYDSVKAICELNSAGTVTAVNTIGDSGLLSRHTGSGSTFYTFDANGNVTERLTSTGTVASADVEDGFGARTTSDTTGDPFGYGGQYGGYTDVETGLVLFTHREYDPATGRWATRDPISYSGGINVYSYCYNEPVADADPTGYREILKNGPQMRCTFDNPGGMGYLTCTVGGKTVLHCKAYNGTTNEGGDRHKDGSDAPIPPVNDGILERRGHRGPMGKNKKPDRWMVNCGIAERQRICIHSGAEGKPFRWYRTQGCIRVDPQCMKDFMKLLQEHPGTITVNK